MNAAHQLFASWHVEVVKDVCQQRDVVTFAEVRFKRAPGPEGDAIGYARSRRIFLCDCQDRSQSAAGVFAFGFCLAMGIPKNPCPAAMSSTLHGFPFFAPARAAINPADTGLRGGKVFAK